MYKEISPFQVMEYVKLNAGVRMLDKKNGDVWEVETQPYNYILEVLDDKTERYYFWVIEKDKTK